MKPEQERVKTVLIDTVSLLCKNGLHFDRELKIQAVIGVSIDYNDVFIVHINETFNPNGGVGGGNGTVSSSAVNSEISLAMVPYEPNTGEGNKVPHSSLMKRPLDASRTPVSASKRMRGGGGMTPTSEGMRQKAKQQLHFASPGKLNATPVKGGGTSPGCMMSPSTVCSPGLSSGSPAARGSQRGVGSPRGGISRGGTAAGRGASLRVLGRGGPRGARGSSRGSGMVRGRGHMQPSGIAGNMKQEAVKTLNEPQSPHLYSSASANFGQSPTNYEHYNSPTSQVQIGNPAASLHRKDHPLIVPGSVAFGLDSNYPTSEQTSSGVQLGSFADVNPSVEFGFNNPAFSSSTANFAPQNAAHPINIKSESGDDADVIFVEDDAATDGTSGGTSSTANQSSSFVDPSGMYADMSGSGDVVQHITRKVTITTNIQGQNVKYEQVQHAVATLPGPSAGGTENPAQDEPLYSGIPLQSLPTASGQYQPTSESYNYNPSGSNVNQQMWDQGPVMPPHSVRHRTPRPAMSPSAVPSMRLPAPRSSAATSGRGGRLATPGGVRLSTGQPTLTPGSSKKSSGSNISVPPLSDIGVGGGSVEDGTAWSLIARFVCNVPGCGASFSKKTNLQRHQSQKHGRQKQTLKQPRNTESGFNDNEEDDTDDYGDEDYM